MLMSSTSKIRVAHHPSCWASVSNAHELDVKDQGSSTWDCRGRAHRTVSVFRLNCELSLFAELHGHDTKIPSFDDLANTDVDFEGLFVDGAIEHSSVFESTCVVN